MGKKQEQIFLRVLTAPQEPGPMPETPAAGAARPRSGADAAALGEFTAARKTFDASMERLMLVQYAFAALMLLLAVFTARALLFPVTGLAAAAGRLRAGQLGATVPAGARDELGALAGAFNAMSRGLKEREDALVARTRELTEALQNVKTLSGLLPICASCKKIRDDGGYWHQVERYITEHSGATFTHGFCPECEKKLYPGLSGD